MSLYRVAVTTKGEAGHLASRIDGYRVSYGMTLDPERADTFSTAERAERVARKAASHFDSAEAVPA